jgi:hypothetical protein
MCFFAISVAVFYYTYIQNRQFIDSVLTDFITLSQQQSDTLDFYASLQLYPLVVPIGSKMLGEHLYKLDIENSGSGAALNIQIVFVGHAAQPCFANQNNVPLAQGKREKITLTPAHPMLNFPHLYEGESLLPFTEEDGRLLLLYQDTVGTRHLTIYSFSNDQWRYITTLHHCSLEYTQLISSPVAAVIANN